MCQSITIVGTFNDGHIITPDGMAYHCLIPKNALPPKGICIFNIVPEGLKYKIIKVRTLESFGSNIFKDNFRR